MIHKRTLAGLEIDIFTHIYVEEIYNMVKDFNIHRCMLEFDTLLLGLLVQENKYQIKSTYL